MKKVFLASLVILLTVTTMNASNKDKNPNKVSIEYAEISTFCKMVRAGNYESVKSFINNGTDINRKSLGLTPLMYAARYNKVKVLKLLIDNGAKLNLKSEKGFTALEYAEMSKANEAYEILKTALEKE
ncbi:ankyrin repeat domain-containing protein [Tenacibaculum sp. TC6]|uniref:ankyrin repeat domain-containing protein n=1 Tax=Tenacibaculum sp. TC6 TaxID=3423223 RepID=UPI003D35CBA8